MVAKRTRKTYRKIETKIGRTYVEHAENKEIGWNGVKV
jgi:hypothetical protein